MPKRGASKVNKKTRPSGVTTKTRTRKSQPGAPKSSKVPEAVADTTSGHPDSQKESPKVLGATGKTVASKKGKRAKRSAPGNTPTVAQEVAVSPIATAVENDPPVAALVELARETDPAKTIMVNAATAAVHTAQIAEAISGNIVANALSAAKEVKPLWVVKNFVQTKTRRSCEFFLDDHSMRVFTRAFPHIMLTPAPRQFTHRHPLLHMDRAWTEEQAIRILSKIVNRYRVTVPEDLLGNKIFVVDVGGNADRHEKNKREIWSCNPLLSAQDTLRAATRTCKTRLCQCRAELCKCVWPLAYLAVQSLYYLEPLTIATLIERSLAKVLVATIHEFSDAYGSFAGGEATYQHVDNHTVSMSVLGNSSAYRHSNLHWMRPGSFALPGDRTLLWNKVWESPWTAVYTFHVVSGSVAPEAPISMDFSSVIQDASYYGAASLTSSAVKDGAITSGGFLELTDTSIYSWGKFVMVYQGSGKQVLLCPKRLVAEVAAWVMGRERTANTFKSALAQFRHRAAQMNIPPELASNSVYAATVLGFVRNIDFETAQMHAILKPMAATMEVHKRAMNMEFSHVWNRSSVAAAAVCAGAGVVAVGAALTAVAGPSIAAGVGGAVVAASAIAGAAAYAFSQEGPITASADSKFASFLSGNGTNNVANTSVSEFSPQFHLKGTPPPQELSVLLDPRTMDSTAKLSLAKADLTAVKENLEDPNPVAPALVPFGITTSTSVPVVPQRCTKTDLAAITTRILKKGPVDRGMVSGKFLDEFEEWIFRPATLKTLKLDGTVTPLTFAAWNSAYPAAVQAKQLEAWNEYNAGVLRGWSEVDRRACFSKIESLAKSTTELMEKLSPRAIQGGTAIHNILTGPFMKALSKHLARVWNCSNERGFTYSSGASAEEIGGRIHAMKQVRDLFAMEGDFARFDSTIHRRLLLIAARLYKMCGISAAGYEVVLSGITTSGSTASGISYEVDGGRKSGDHDTSVGNTILQSLAIMFCYCHYLAVPSFEESKHDEAPVACTTALSAQTLMDVYSFNMIGLGDDNFVTGSSDLSKVPIRQLLLQLGLELEPKYMDASNVDYAATFCSSIVLPATNAKTGEEVHVLSAPIGRVYTKGGWAVNLVNTSVNKAAMARAYAVSHQIDHSHIPFLKEIADVCLSRANTKSTLSADRAARKLLLVGHKAQTREAHIPNDETWRVLAGRYNLSRSDLLEFKTLLSKVTSLPACVDLPCLTRAAQIDGMDGGITTADTPSLYLDPATVPGESIVLVPDMTRNCEMCLRPADTDPMRSMCSCPGAPPHVVDHVVYSIDEHSLADAPLESLNAAEIELAPLM